MFDLIASVLAWFYELYPSYGLSIVLLTLVVMAITTPFTLKGTKSMIQMQRLQPQLKAIQTRYRDDREKMNQELLKFYKANNINPVGGCLPMFIQIPVFIVLFRVLSGLTRRVTDVGMQAGATAMDFRLDMPGFRVAEVGERTFNPSYISGDSALYKSLVDSTTMKSWGIDLSESASAALGRSIGHAVPYLLLIAAVLVTGLIQTRQIQGRQSAGSQVNPQQQMIMKVMPFFLPVFSFGMPAGLVVYFVASNLWRIGQQGFITRTLYAGGKAEPLPVAPFEDEEEATPTPARSAKTAKTAKASKTASTATSTATRSAMGRNRRAAAEGTAARAKTASRKPSPKKASPPAPSRPSGRVTPPGGRAGGGSASRKKKRN
jgi:YidC/Oxa1 family membrane protein insertase